MKHSRKIILASTSPSRAELLKQIGLKFTAEASDYEEDLTLKVSPKELVKTLSQGKARAVAKKHDNAIVIGADLVAVLGKEVLGKPKDATDAKRMLRKLSGKTHQSFAGLTVIDTKASKEISKVVETKVHFRKLDPREIDGYIASKEPFGKAGAYAIQQTGAMFVKSIHGEYSAVMGLPLAELAVILKKLGVSLYE